MSARAKKKSLKWSTGKEIRNLDDEERKGMQGDDNSNDNRNETKQRLADNVIVQPRSRARCYSI